ASLQTSRSCSFSMASATVLRRSSLRAARMRRAPEAAKVRAQASPMPALAPVIRTILPVISIGPSLRLVTIPDPMQDGAGGHGSVEASAGCVFEKCATQMVERELGSHLLDPAA